MILGWLTAIPYRLRGGRADEFEQRLRAGAISRSARDGGGICPRAADQGGGEGDRCSEPMVSAADVALGVTTVECKSGYGLAYGGRAQAVRVYRRMATTDGAPGADLYSRALILRSSVTTAPGTWTCGRPMIPAIVREELAVCCDVLVEDSAFTSPRLDASFERARTRASPPSCTPIN